MMRKRQKVKKEGLINIYKLAQKMAREGKYKESEEKFNLILKLDPNNVYAFVGLGNLKRKMKAFQKAVFYYEKALKIESNNKYAIVGLGDAYRGLKKIDNALEIWLNYLSLVPDDYKTMTRIADGFRKINDFEE